MDISDYKFNVGDEVITTTGQRGKIINICTCGVCMDRGFCEPVWKEDNTDCDEHYITNVCAANGFTVYYKIGKYRFNDFDKDNLLHQIKWFEDELAQLNKQLQLINDLERKD